MPVHNFMLADLLAYFAAVALFPLFAFVPGYAAGWALDLFAFRRRSAAFRWALSIPLAIAFCPILTYLAGRFGSMHVVFVLYGAAAVYFLSVCRLAVPRISAAFSAVLGVWLLLALYLMIDIQIGHRLYFPASTIDHALRSAFIHAVSATGIPPQNPFFFPGHGFTLRYHYFWFMICSLVDLAGGTAVSARQALMAGTFWCGIGLIGLLAVYLRLLAASGAAGLERRLRTGILLCAITGLDILPSLFFLMLHIQGKVPAVLPSVEWWNEHVDWFLYTAVWAPHALAGMIAGFVALLLLWHGSLRYALAAGVALASAAGLSIYVAFVFAVFFAIWTLVTLCRRWHADSVALLAAGAVAAGLALPYLSDLRGPGAGGPLLQFSIRTFSLAALVPGGTQAWVRILLIPFNYLIELGFFSVAGYIRWREYRRGRTLSRAGLAGSVLAGTSILLCTFIKSSVIGCNDLGWRGFLPAEFILLLWSIDTLAGWKRLSENWKIALSLCLILGAAGTLYDIAIVRLHPILADAGVIPPLDWMGSDRQIGRRTYANRAAYEWAHDRIPKTAAMQFNPNVVFEEAYSMYYSERRNIAGDRGCLAAFGGDPAQCGPIVSKLQRIYAEAGGERTPAALAEACAAVPADWLVAKDTDPIWQDRSSWVWSAQPAFANSYVRLFSCEAAAPPALAAQ